MTTMNKTTFCRAMLAALSTLGMMTPAHAVNLNPQGQGQVLLYPYYTVRNGFDTYVSVVNATTAVKAIRVRFLEGKNARPVLDFNLYLSPQDIWTGAVTATPDGAKLVSVDKSCTTPQIPAEGLAFSNKLYSGPAFEGFGLPPAGSGGDGSSQLLDRTREGYFEVIEMGVVTNTTYARAITHTAAGVPANCALLQDASMAMTPAPNPAAVAPPAGGLSGTASLVNVASGIDFGYDATALAAFYTGTGNLWAPSDSKDPGLHNAFPNTSVVVKGGVPIVTNWGIFGEDAVSAVLMTANISNNYTVEPGLDAATDWIVTMPTKHYYVPVNQPAAGPDYSRSAPPFTTAYWNGACEEFILRLWDREEGASGGLGPSISPFPVGSFPNLCWASTIVSFNASAPSSASNMPLTASTVLGSTNLMTPPISSNSRVSVDSQSGWAALGFNPAFSSQDHLLISPNAQTMPATASGSHTYQGLPTIGFMVESFKNNNALPGILATYGGNFNHKTTSVINGSAAE